MNGWKNHETWNFMLWHADDIHNYVEQYAMYFVSLNDQELADDIAAFAYTLLGLNELPIGFVRDTVMQSFDRISWIEVARAHDYLLEDERDSEEEEVLPW